MSSRGNEQRGWIARLLAPLALSVLVMLATVGCWRPPPKPTGPTYLDDAAPLVKAFAKRFGKGTQVCKLIVYPRRVEVEYEAGSGKTEALELDQAFDRFRPRSPGWCMAEPVRPLADALFPLASVDLSLVPAMAQQAAKRLGLRSSAEVTHLLLERPADVKGAGPQWRAFAPSGLGWVSFDLAGRFVAGIDRHANALDSKGKVDFFADASAIPKAIESRLGKDFRLVELLIFRTYFHLEGKGPGAGAKLERYQVLHGQFGSPGPGAWAFREDLDQLLFPPSALDWSLVPKMVADAKARSGDPTAEISYLKVQQGIHFKPLSWMVYLQGGAFYVYSAKGELFSR